MVAYDPFVAPNASARRASTHADTPEERLCAGRLRHAPPAADAETLRCDRRRGVRADEGRRDRSLNVSPRPASIDDGRPRPRRSTRGKLGGAAPRRLLRPSPSLGRPLLQRHPNVVVTPHLAASTDEAQDRAWRDRRRAGRGRARRRRRHERGEHPLGRRRGSRRCSARSCPSRPASATSRSSSPTASRARSRSEHHGELAERDTRLLTLAALNGAFRGRVDQPVNYVNAPLIAAERGIEVVEAAAAAPRATSRT